MRTLVHALALGLAVAGCVATPSVTTSPSPVGSFPGATSTPSGPSSPPPVPLAVTLTGFSGGVTTLAWSPDGSVLATATGAIGSTASTSSVIRLWHPDGTAAGTLGGHRDVVTALAWSPDGALLASGSFDGTVRLWRPNGSLASILHPNIGAVHSVAWSPNGERLAIGAIRSPTDNNAEIWSRAGALLKTLHTAFSGGKFYNLAWSPDGRFLVTGATDYALWTAAGGLIARTPGCAHCTPAWGLAWAPDSSAWAIGDESGDVTIYDTSGAVAGSVRADRGVTALAWLPDASGLVCGNQLFRRDGTLVTGLTLAGEVDALAWSPDRTLVAASTSQDDLAVFDPSGSLRLSMPPDWAATGMIATQRLAWSPDGRLLSVGYSNSTVRIWDVGHAIGG